MSNWRLVKTEVLKNVEPEFMEEAFARMGYAPDFDVKEITALKRKIWLTENIIVGCWIFLLLFGYFNWDNWVPLLVIALIGLYIQKKHYKKQLKQKEYLAKIVEERTIELRIQRDQILKESKELSNALQALEKAQNELVQKERLATVGQLTQGLVDRILNPINYINNFAGLSSNLVDDLRKNLEEGKAALPKDTYEDSLDILDMLDSNLKKIGQHGYNTMRVVKGMEEMLKDRHGDITQVDLEDLCQVAVKTFTKQFQQEVEGKHIRIEVTAPGGPVMAEVYIEQMHKVLFSLLKNSLYALSKKLQKEAFEPLIRITVENIPNDTASIAIYDNGIGIEDQIKSKIFEPFFTTKPTSEAAGVGLYLCREMILNHQGSIIVKSKKDVSTEFIITIPVKLKTTTHHE